jgi:glutathione synthase/RimK-type ligase-like ATP-grasp enzyme
VCFQFNKKWTIKRLSLLDIDEVPDSHQDFLMDSAKAYFSRKRFYIAKKQHKCVYDLAILINKTEKNAPSNKKALDKFMKAGEEVGLNVSLIEKEDFRSLLEYDALFIRETTSVNHHTYRFARKASAEGLIVVDDPVSILRCANKVYLAEMLTKHRINAPKTIIISKLNYKTIVNDIKFPCVLKQPDSAFSEGVIKVDSIASFKEALDEFFKQSELVIIQEYMPTDYDWRIGILNNVPIFACRYYMAKNHWQIYDWNATEKHDGNSDTVPIEEVPKSILDVALKATKYIGEGLYGVDLKQTKDNIYVIEVNDNPNIEEGVEDLVAGDDLYHNIMNYFFNNLKRLHQNE